MERRENSLELSLLKGIGIIAVVLGHTSMPNLVRMIYYWHLPLFFFLIGLTYNADKYEKNVSFLLASRLHSFFPMYFCYMVILGLLHNTFYMMGILPDGQTIYDINTGFHAFVNYFHLWPEPLCGALWFMFPYFFATLIYGVIMSIGTSMELKSKERQLLVISICILCAIVGFICTSQGLIRTNDHIDVALVIMPFVAIGGVYRLFKKKIRPFINGVFCSIALLLILVANFKFDASIALDQRRYIGFIPFYVLSFSGIYCCLYLVRILEKWRRGKKISLWVCEVGKYSMDIMTLHFVFFKLVDFFYSKVVTIDNSFVLSKYPRSLNSHWSVFIYVVVGIYGPICVRKFLNKLFHKLNTNFLLFS